MLLLYAVVAHIPLLLPESLMRRLDRSDTWVAYHLGDHHLSRAPSGDVRFFIFHKFYFVKKMKCVTLSACMDVGKVLQRFAWLLVGIIVFPAFLIAAVIYPIWEEWGKSL
ncbi:MAG: hypothetical protein COV34_01630 [Candidatus Zambryskibacteria bacterium CG10_big_fil_rev_8_21_14_0_10_42_12]|uniref:Uncharacterized protein n=1 Tax=Candidatus Zambryskibacteria bacterium CG10_big_fil_rev_8_21_14_0_10_42_12 TaxID=1975115 RepID=A0A2H0QVH5_9BACT|nr:MAG: hypothetical protein COV34_01630 [Candidatus Zambryskibacteria bacterium CG10_big_fil_rev_8_21_14_0_10_42_12]